MTAAKPPTRYLGPLPWRRRLRVKLALLFMVVFVLLGLAALAINHVIVQSRLIEEIDRYAQSDSQRIIAGLNEIVSSTEQLATSLAVLAEAGGFSGLDQSIACFHSAGRA